MSKFTKDKQGVALRCPNCGSSVVYDVEKKSFVCKVCKSEFDEAELQRKATSFVESKTFDEEVKSYHCPSCGAEVIADENTATKFCAFCGTPVVLSGRVSGLLKPDLIIPFEISKEGAKQRIKQFLKNYTFVPHAFYKEANLNKITGIYYPFWESDINMKSKMVAEGCIVDTWVQGDMEYTETSYYELERAGDIRLDDVSVNALKDSDKKLVESILPYPISKHIPFDMKYLSGYCAKKNDLKYEDVKNEILSKGDGYAKDMLLSTTKRYSNVRIKDYDSKIQELHNDYTLLPIWILNYKYRQKNYTFAVNGVTGKVFGEVPLSRAKLGLTACGVGGIVLGILALIGGVLI